MKKLQLIFGFHKSSFLVTAALMAFAVPILFFPEIADYENMPSKSEVSQMKRLRRISGIGRTPFLTIAAFIALAVPILFCPARAIPIHAQSEAAATYPPGYEFDVATIKPSQDTSLGGAAGFTEDSYRARNMTIRFVIRAAYDLWAGREEMVLGGPKWLDTDGYYITAKMDPAVADKLKKLTPDQRTLLQNQMLRALLADRFKLSIHREPKELPVYAMTIAKTGLKLHEAKPGDDYADATFPNADKFDGRPQAGAIFRVGGGGPTGNTMTIYGFGVSMPALAKELGVMAGQTVQDKTGLAGNYDFALKWWTSPMRPPSEGAPDGQPASAASDPAGGPSLFSAIQQQLGLKLDSGKGAVQVVVIDHIDRPSGN
jgi:uncharacterized protein (TIGR03435 family)